MRRRDALTALLLAAVVGLVAGCSAHPNSAPSGGVGHQSGAQSPGASPTPTPKVFSVPTSCLDVVSKARQQTFAAKGLTLLYGPGSASGQLLGRYPDVAEPGSISCDWGTPDESSSIEIDVGPVNPTDRAEIIASLGADLPHSAPDPHTDIYNQDGVAAHISAKTDILRSTSWITVEILPGGADALTLAIDIASEAETTTHAK